MRSQADLQTTKNKTQKLINLNSILGSAHPYISTKNKGVRHINILQSSELMRRDQRVNSVYAHSNTTFDDKVSSQNPSFVQKK
jgi:hypothetical protein